MSASQCGKVHVSIGAHEIQKGASDPSEAGVAGSTEIPDMVLATELQASVRARHALNH